MIELSEGLEWSVTANGKYCGNAKTAAEWQSTIDAALKAKTITPADLAYPNVVKYLPVEVGFKPEIQVDIILKPTKKVVRTAKPKSEKKPTTRKKKVAA